MKITAIILTQNSERHIEECLKSVQWMDEILVIDGGSTDNTVVLAEKLKAKVIVNSWPGFSVQRNLGLEIATNEWVLMLDVDERVTPELRCEIQNALATLNEIVGFSIPTKNHFWGKWMRGWYPDRHTRLFNKSKARFIDRIIHESVILDGNIKCLQNPLIHFSYESLTHFVIKMNNYSSLGAQEKKQQGNSFSAMKLLLHPFTAFIKMYIIKGGFRDGIPGFVFAVSYSFYVFMKYAKLYPAEQNIQSQKICSESPQKAQNIKNQFYGS